MRIRVFILSFVCVALLFGAAPGQSAQTATHDARLVLIKYDRLLHMYKDGKIIKSYKVALGALPSAQKHGREITRRRKVTTFSIPGTRRVTFTSPFTFRIRARAIAQRRARIMLHPEETYLSTAYRTDTDG
jgi:hypothetical protein